MTAAQERAWYDGHREEILRGREGERLQEEGIDLFQVKIGAAVWQCCLDYFSMFTSSSLVFNCLSLTTLSLLLQLSISVLLKLLLYWLWR